MNQSNRPPFGQTAVELGYLSETALNSALAEQAAARQSDSNAWGAGPIGALLVAKGALSSAQAAEVLRRLASSRLPLSEDGIRLASRLKVLHAKPSNVIGIAASHPSDAARLAAEVATALAVMEQGQVLALEADLRAPALARCLGVPQSPGMTEALRAGQSPAGLPTAASALEVLPAGASANDAASLAMSPAAAQALAALRQRYRYVIVQLGDLLRHPEAAVAASRCDAVAVVLRAGSSSKDDLIDMQRLLTGLDVPISGVVLARPSTRGERQRAQREAQRTATGERSR